jgi:hypothetical protein
VSEEKFSKCGEGKNVSVKFRVFGKKNRRRVREKKNQSVLGKKKKKIFLSSCSLVGLYVNLQVKVTEKFDGNFSKYFRVGF